MNSTFKKLLPYLKFVLGVGSFLLFIFGKGTTAIVIAVIAGIGFYLIPMKKKQESS